MLWYCLIFGCYRDGGASGLIVKRISDRLAQQTEKFKQLVNREENQKMANRYGEWVNCKHGSKLV